MSQSQIEGGAKGRPGTSGRPGGPPAGEAPELRERGGMKDDQPQFSDRRLYVQFLAFGDCVFPKAAVEVLRKANVSAAVYEDISDPRGIAIATWSEDPNFFFDTLRPLLQGEPFAKLTPRPELTMFGRTYALGYEPDLDETLLQRPIRHLTERDWPWAIWYPLRRKGSFAQLGADEQKAILREHGVIGYAFGSADHAHDIRLACFGLDRQDNDFVIGLFGRELHALSLIVQTMRKTRQTSEYIEKLGPFFVGRAVWKHDARAKD